MNLESVTGIGQEKGGHGPKLSLMIGRSNKTREEGIIMKFFLVVLVSLSFLTRVDAQTTQFAWTPDDTPSALAWDGSDLPAASTVLTYLTSELSSLNFDPLIPLQNSYGSDFFYSANSSGLGFGPGSYSTANMSDDLSIEGLNAYVVLLDLSFSDFTTIYGSDVTQVPLGTYFGYSSIVAGPITDRGDPPQAGQEFDVGVIQTNLQVIPEPGTIALAILGIGMLGVRRFVKARKV